MKTWAQLLLFSVLFEILGLLRGMRAHVEWEQHQGVQAVAALVSSFAALVLFVCAIVALAKKPKL